MSFPVGIGLGVVSMLVLGFQTYIMAKASRRIGPLRTSLWYQAVSLGILLLLSFFLFSYGGLTWLTLPVLVLNGIVSVAGILAFTKGLEVGRVSVVVTVASAWGAVTAILGVILLGDSMTAMQAAFIALIIAGTVLTSLNPEADAGGKRAAGLGIDYAVATLFCWGAYYFLSAFLDKSLGWFAVTLFLTALSVLFLAGYGALRKEPLKVGRGSLGVLAVMGAFNVISLLAYNLGVTLSYTAIVAPIAAASPVVTIILALVLLREKLALNQKAGIVMILAGIVLLAL